MPELNDLTADEERQFAEGQPRGFPFDPEFRMEDVMLPENDDMDIASEDDEVAEEEIQTETGFGSVIGIIGTQQQRHLPNAASWAVQNTGSGNDISSTMQLWTICLKSLLRSKKSLQQ